eukprot:TRINITY_DN70125_c0_g1_i1.p1 TRINITY_DN70125_c0_g1~~TRINITY_DN70125_c0_g1_i1.p1  ORF type:complete len:171 (-),score=26.57 TRINITY_DN70125_c0_g1_i1:253-765(-)
MATLWSAGGGGSHPLDQNMGSRDKADPSSHLNHAKCVSNTGTFRYCSPRLGSELATKDEAWRNPAWGSAAVVALAPRLGNTSIAWQDFQKRPVPSSARSGESVCTSGVSATPSTSRGGKLGGCNATSRLTAAGATTTQPSPPGPIWGLQRRLRTGDMPKPASMAYGNFYY